MSDSLRVQLQSPSAAGALTPHYDESVGILSLVSPEPRDWPYGLDIDGRVICDLDAMGRLANLDLLMGQKTWRREALVRPPQGPRRDLAFPQAVIVQKSFVEKVTVAWDGAQKLLEIRVGTLSCRETWPLSEHVWVRLGPESVLCGWSIWLPER